MYSIQFNSIHFISMNARDAFVRSPLFVFRVNQSNQNQCQITINRAIDDRPRGNPLPTRTKKTRVAPGHPFPSQSMSAARWPARVPPLCPCVYPPPCVYPGYTHTPSTIPLDGSAPVDRDTSTGHVRQRCRVAPSPHKKGKKKNIPTPPLKMQKYTPTGGQSSSYSTHTRVRQIPARTRVRDG